MSEPVSQSLAQAFAAWPPVQRGLLAAVGRLTPAQLALHPNGDPARWPLWASVGHLCCSRVFWLCDFAGEPGAATTPFPNAGWDCPGDDDLEHVLDAPALIVALESTWALVERALATWTPAMLEETIEHPDWEHARSHTRGWALSRVFAHDLWHASELSEALVAAGLPPLDPW